MLKKNPINIQYQSAVSSLYSGKPTFQFTIEYSESANNSQPLELVEASIRETVEIAIQSLKDSREKNLVGKLKEIREAAADRNDLACDHEPG